MNLRYFILITFSFLISDVVQGNPFYQISDGGPRQNFTDEDGLRQGYWQLIGAIAKEEGFRKDQVVEEGEYLDNRREGLWKKYYPTGDLRSEITYSENHPFGYYKTYYPNGNPEEEGYWKGNRNTGEFKRFHDNGKIAQDFNFNSRGKRDGIQKYFYDTGKPQLTVEVENGIAHGTYLSYYPDGKKKEEKRITNGEVEAQSVRKYEPAKAYLADVTLPTLPSEETKPDLTDRPNLEVFRETGYNTLYNKNQQVSQVGIFEAGRLYEGKWYRYDENGLLTKVEIYRGGQFIGYGVIDDSNK